MFLQLCSFYLSRFDFVGVSLRFGGAMTENEVPIGAQQDRVSQAAPVDVSRGASASCRNMVMAPASECSMSP